MNKPLPAELQHWLEWAGARLIALPVPRIKPAEPGVLWPEYSQDKFEILEFRGRLPLRALAPAAREIPTVDLILTLPNVCESRVIRRILHARSLVHPISGRNLFSWSKIAYKLHLSAATVRRFHSAGLAEACKKSDPNTILSIRKFFLDESEKVA